ncbi:MAG: TraR/DksA family transcriptional regulator [Kiritimatiellae bacterium]|nr:TraR/DksA family transcriptional regulator [Kiritimatiellia bacterium]
MATKKGKAPAKSAKKAVKKAVKKAPSKTAKKATKKAFQSVFSKQSGEKGYPPKRRTPIRNPGKRKPLSERNPNRVAPRIVHKQEPSPDFVEVVPEIKSEKALAFAQEIARRMKLSARKEDEARDAVEEIRLSRRPTTRKQGKATDKFPAADLKDFRRRLLEARESAQNGVDVMKATGFNESDDYEADGGDGTNQTLRLQALGQMGNINRTIQKIDEALHRIDDGTYGVCAMCGHLIRKPRLLNQPFVLTCMECQNEVERQERGRRQQQSSSSDMEVEEDET